jgi:hypothetical protein
LFLSSPPPPPPPPTTNPTSSCLRAEENLSPGSTSYCSSTTPRSSSSEQVHLFPLSHTFTLNNPHLNFRDTPTTYSEKRTRDAHLLANRRNTHERTPPSHQQKTRTRWERTQAPLMGNCIPLRFLVSRFEERKRALPTGDKKLIPFVAYILQPLFFIFGVHWR